MINNKEDTKLTVHRGSHHGHCSFCYPDSRTLVYGDSDITCSGLPE